MKYSHRRWGGRLHSVTKQLLQFPDCTQQQKRLAQTVASIHQRWDRSMDMFACMVFWGRVHVCRIGCPPPILTIKNTLPEYGGSSWGYVTDSGHES